MRPLRLASLWKLLGLLMVLGVLVASLMPPPEMMGRYSDKFFHVITYLSLAAWFGAVYQRRWHIAVLSALVGLGITIEFLQQQTGYRSFEINDMIADAIGAGAGIALAATPMGNALQWFERRMVSH